jgi:RNA polymerase sigma-70 factor (ECF subfamily)
MNQRTDHEWMISVAQGNLVAMSPIYENRHRALFCFFFRLTGRQTASEDLVHEVFLRMIRYRHTYESKPAESKPGAVPPVADSFESWMYRIARNALADHARKHRMETAVGDRELEEVPSSRPTPFDTTSKRQNLALLYRALRTLPDDKRELLVLARFEDLDYEQIGRVLGCGANTVKGRVFRAIKELGEIYTDLQKEKAS